MGRKISIVIPTWNHLEDLLIPCVNSVEKYTTSKYDLEFIFVANGCTDNTHEWLAAKYKENPKKYRFFIDKEQIGFTKAANIGFKMATTDLVIILNNDTEILDHHPADVWLNMLVEPFDTDDKIAATGPLKIFDYYSNREFLVGFCVMYRTDILKKFNYFDETFAPAGGEDVDLAIRIQDAGYKIHAVTSTKYDGTTNVGSFPMWHKDNRSYRELPEYTQFIIKRNGHINCKRHNKNIKLNIGGGGIEYKGWLNVDFYDKRADILMDISKPMDFDTDSVSEILASHVFEHLNPYRVNDILKEWIRILKPGGKLSMELPDIEQLCKRFVTANVGQRYGILNAIYGSVNTSGEGDPGNITSPHLFGWWPQSLYDHLANAGFVNIKFMPEQIPHPESNMRVEADKPGTLILPKQIVEEIVQVPDVPKPWPSASMSEESYKHMFGEIFIANEYGIEHSELAGKSLIDVGASIGLFSQLAIDNHIKHIVAVEANPSVFNDLYKRFKDTPSVTIVNAAVYDDSSQQVKLTNNGSISKISVDGTIVVRTVTLNTLLKQFKPEEELVLKIDCEGAEFPILMSSSKEDLQKFKYIYAEIHGTSISGRKISEILEFMSICGFESIDMHHDIVYYENDLNGNTMRSELLAKTYKFIRMDKSVVPATTSSANPYGVTAYISTKDRYFTTLPLAIVGIANQSWKVDELIIFDDGEQKDLREHSLYKNLFRYLEMRGINWQVVFGQKKGQVANHQIALEMAKTEYIWRVDDDNYPESEVLQRLMMWLTCPVAEHELPFGAVGGLVRVPHQEIFPVEQCSGDIRDCIEKPNYQWSAFSGVLHTDHLHNTFLYKKSAATHGYQRNLSPVGHREETLFTHGIRNNGYRLLVCADVITWHFRESTGGIRAYNDVALWEHDDKIFKEEMKKRGVLFDNKKYIVLDNGIGDHYAFKAALRTLLGWNRCIEENVVIATCFPEVFEDMKVRQISIADANLLFGDLTRFNIYHWMWSHDWKRSIVDAYMAMYF